MPETLPEGGTCGVVSEWAMMGGRQDVVGVASSAAQHSCAVLSSAPCSCGRRRGAGGKSG